MTSASALSAAMSRTPNRRGETDVNTFLQLLKSLMVRKSGTRGLLLSLDERSRSGHGFDTGNAFLCATLLFGSVNLVETGLAVPVLELDLIARHRRSPCRYDAFVFCSTKSMKLTQVRNEKYIDI
jgi:hypothetical protein